MKTVTIEEVGKNFQALLSIVQGGEELNLVRRKKPVARIVPVTGVTRSSHAAKKRRMAWTEHFAKLDAIYGGQVGTRQARQPDHHRGQAVRVYFDPSVLISFYVAEPAGAGVRKFVSAQDLLIL